MKNNRASYSLVFYISKTKARKNGQVPVYLQIYMDGQKTSFQIRRHILPELWDNVKSKMKGRTAEAKAFNDYLDAIILRAHNQYSQLLKEHDHVTPFQLRDAIMGTNTDQPRRIIEIWDTHNENLSKLIGIETSAATVQKYTTCKNHFRSFLEKNYRVKDVSIKQINHEMIESFGLYLKTDKNCGYNTAVKFLQNFKKIVHIALKNGWLTKDPFSNISLSLKEVSRPYLTEKELEKIVNLKSKIDRINKVKDFFVFSCFTGLAYSDVKKLKGSDIVKEDLGYWIKTFRTKTNTFTNVPLLPVPMKIIRMYCNIDELHDEELVFPLLSNQKMNAYLKELADLTGITKNLSYHVARHTFATTVTLMNGVTIESVSKMLGHKDIKTSQHYARIIDKKIEEDMSMLHQKLNKSNVYNIE